MLGDRLLTQDSVMLNGTMMCTKDVMGPIFHHYCVDQSNTSEACDYFNNPNTEARLVKAIPGMPSGIFSRELLNLTKILQCMSSPPRELLNLTEILQCVSSPPRELLNLTEILQCMSSPPRELLNLTEILQCMSSPPRELLNLTEILQCSSSTVSC